MVFLQIFTIIIDHCYFGPDGSFSWDQFIKVVLEILALSVILAITWRQDKRQEHKEVEQDGRLDNVEDSVSWHCFEDN